MPEDLFLNLNDFKAAAEAVMDRAIYTYYAGGSGDQVTLRDNRSAYERIKLLPRYMVDVSQRDLSTEILGQSLSMPVVVAPMALMGLAHPDRELGIARACKEAGIIMALSTMSTSSVEEVAATGVDLWFQLYVHKDRGLTRHLVERAEAAGCKALVLTVDVPLTSYREGTMRLPFALPPDMTLANVADYWDRAQQSDLMNYGTSQFDPSLSWKDVEALAGQTKLPLLIKGLLHPGDAVKAIEAGAAGIVVSNHGGRQLDTCPATIEALPGIVEAVAGQVEVMVDGGIRRGSDMIKALAYGAKAVMLGRPLAFALAVNGQAGVAAALEILRYQYDIDMALCGLTDSRQIPRDVIAP